MSRFSLTFGLLQARIALLEGERRSFENVKLDLMRRIKMLEYALRMERWVFVIKPLSIIQVFTCCIPAQNSSVNQLGHQFLLQSWLLSRPKVLHRLTRATRGVIRRGAVVALHEAKVNFHLSSYTTYNETLCRLSTTPGRSNA
jgi:hypothetical protein